MFEKFNAEEVGAVVACVLSTVSCVVPAAARVVAGWAGQVTSAVAGRRLGTHTSKSWTQRRHVAVGSRVDAPGPALPSEREGHVPCLQVGLPGGGGEYEVQRGEE